MPVTLDGMQNGISQCLVRIHASDTVECMMTEVDCQMALRVVQVIGLATQSLRVCRHPSAAEMAEKAKRDAEGCFARQLSQSRRAVEQENKAKKTGSKCKHNKDKGLDACLENKACQWAITVLNLRYCANPAIAKNSTTGSGLECAANWAPTIGDT